MKKSKLLFGAMALMTMGLASCSSDDIAAPGNETIEKDQTSYLSVAICNPTSYMTRADEFDNGAESESEVNQLVFVFYDGSGAPTATMYSLDSGDAELQTGWTDRHNGVGTEGNVTRFWKSVIPVEMIQGQNKPVYVMCYVNPIDQTNLATATLEEVDAATRLIVANNNKFAMSNAVYYGSNPITGQSNVRVMATPITEGQLHATQEEADADDTPLDIYVERYAAKIGLTMGTAAVAEGYPVIDAADNTEKTIVFTPEFWHPNAMDTKTYITKGFTTTASGSVATAVPYATMTTAFEHTGMAGEGINGWNNQDNHRSYWACSPSYYAGAYPQCSDNITDAGAINYELKYFTYNEAKTGVNTSAVKSEPGIGWNETNGFATNSATTDGWFYARETTASLEALTGENVNNKAVAASAVIVGNYKLAGAENATTFYLYGKQNGKDVYYGTEASVETALIANQNVIFTSDKGNMTDRVTDPAYFEVKHPSQDVRTKTVTEGEKTTKTIQNVAGRLVTIQIKKDELENLDPIYFYNGTGFVQVDDTNIDVANRLLWSSASTAQKFNNGHAFFSIPIRHLGWGKGTIPADKPLYTQNANGTQTINWQNLRRGDLGVVRNHVYQLEVTGIVGLGIGLGEDTQPMVPPMDPDNYYISARLNILAWRVVPAQTGIVL